MQDIWKLKIFDGIDVEIVHNILSQSKTRNFLPWEYIINQWDESNGEWYIIISWEVEVLIDKKHIKYLKNWEIFWEIALLNEEQRIADIKATSEVKVIVLTLENILEIVNSGNESINRGVMTRLEENLLRNEA